jgi:hypothetical protein
MDPDSEVNTVARQAGKNRKLAFRGSVFAPIVNAADLINNVEGYLGKQGDIATHMC